MRGIPMSLGGLIVSVIIFAVGYALLSTLMPIVALPLAVVLWLVVIVAVLHHKDVWPDFIRNQGIIMDVLDRLTNKQDLERAYQGMQTGGAVLIDAEELAGKLKSKVIGQDAVCEDLANQIRRRMALDVRNKPIAVFLLAGPPGTGKTFLAKNLGKAMDKKLLHIDMTQYANGHEAAQLFGSPKGYAGSDKYGLLSAHLRDYPDSIILLDEIEKAAPEVHKKFLTAWNDGFITEASDGKQISTSKAIFLATTNAAYEEIETATRTYKEEPDELRKVANNALKECGFAPEVLSRIDRICVFYPLEGLDVARVTALEIEAAIENYGLKLADEGIDVTILLGAIERHQKQGAGGARELARLVEEEIADGIIEAKEANATTIRLIESTGKVEVLVVE